MREIVTAGDSRIARQKRKTKKEDKTDPPALSMLAG
jgi:hypothetical protein